MIKKIPHILFISLFAVLVLSACNKAPQGVGEAGMPQDGSATAVPETVTSEAPAENENVGEDAPTPTPTSNRFEGNVNCGMLKNQANRSNCEAQVSELVGNLIYSEIVSTFDAGRCKELTDFFVQQCEDTIAQTGVTGPVSAEELQTFQSALSGEIAEPGEGEVPSSLTLTFDSGKCAELKTAGYKAYCEKSIQRRMEQDSLNEIFATGTEADCNKLTDESVKQSCEDYFSPPQPVPPAESALDTPVPSPEDV